MLLSNGLLSFIKTKHFDQYTVKVGYLCLSVGKWFILAKSFGMGPVTRISWQQKQHSCSGCSVTFGATTTLKVTSTKSSCFCHWQVEVVILSRLLSRWGPWVDLVKYPVLNEVFRKLYATLSDSQSLTVGRTDVLFLILNQLACKSKHYYLIGCFAWCQAFAMQTNVVHICAGIPYYFQNNQLLMMSD